MKQFRQNQTVYVLVKFRVDGVFVDPANVTLRVRPPNRANEYTLTYPNASYTKVSTGIYRAKVRLNEAGNWIFGGEGVGGADGYDEMVVDVLPSLFTP